MLPDESRLRVGFIPAETLVQNAPPPEIAPPPEPSETYCIRDIICRGLALSTQGRAVRHREGQQPGRRRQRLQEGVQLAAERVMVGSAHDRPPAHALLHLRSLGPAYW